MGDCSSLHANPTPCWESNDWPTDSWSYLQASDFSDEHVPAIHGRNRDACIIMLCKTIVLRKNNRRNKLKFCCRRKALACIRSYTKLEPFMELGYGMEYAPITNTFSLTCGDCQSICWKILLCVVMMDTSGAPHALSHDLMHWIFTSYTLSCTVI